ncbi:MAG: hypothetical protein V3T48_06350 [Vicinamibacterales bacterium]
MTALSPSPRAISTAMATSILQWFHFFGDSVATLLNLGDMNFAFGDVHAVGASPFSVALSDRGRQRTGCIKDFMSGPGSSRNVSVIDDSERPNMA